MKGGGYRVQPGDSISYEVKWYPPDPIDPDDPVSGRAPGAAPGAAGAGAGGDESDRSSGGDSSSGGGGGGGSGPRGESESAGAALVALDVECDDGSRLSATDATDQHGLLAHPGTDLRGAMRVHGTAGWLYRAVPLPASMVGRTLTRWMAGCEHDHPARVRAALRNVRVLGGAGGGEVVYAALPSVGRPRVVHDDDD